MHIIYVFCPHKSVYLHMHTFNFSSIWFCLNRERGFGQIKHYDCDHMENDCYHTMVVIDLCTYSVCINIYALKLKDTCVTGFIYSTLNTTMPLERTEKYTDEQKHTRTCSTTAKANGT